MKSSHIPKRWRVYGFLSLAVAFTFFILACGESAIPTPTPMPTPTATLSSTAIPTPTPDSPKRFCQPVTPLFSVVEVISDQGHLCRECVYQLQGRVTRSGQQSASVWSLRTEAGTGLVVSALHTLIWAQEEA